MSAIEWFIVLLVFSLCAGLVYEHHVVDPARAVNALDYCEEKGYNSYMGYRGFILDETPVAVRCTYPQQGIKVETGSDTKSYREGYL